MITAYELIELYDNWKRVKINDKELNEVLYEGDPWKIHENGFLPKYSFINAEVMSFGVYDDELCIRVNYSAEDRKKSGVRVQAWTRDEYVGYLDVMDLEPGMLVRELGGLIEVTGKAYDDGIDYMIPTEEGSYSPLLLV